MGRSPDHQNSSRGDARLFYYYYHFPEKLIPHVILNAIHGKPLPIYGSGLQIRDWLYVEDHAKALIKVVTEVDFLIDLLRF